MNSSAGDAGGGISALDAALVRVLEARSWDPFAVLGRQLCDDDGSKARIRVLIPGAESVNLAESGQPFYRIAGTDLFEWEGLADLVTPHYRLIWRDSEQLDHIGHDPYCFAPQLSEFDLSLFRAGEHRHAYRMLGAHVHVVGDIQGVLFSVWAPNAERVSVVGDFNRWDGRRHPMRVREGFGVWELFVPDLMPGELYKFELRNRHNGQVFLKADPYAQQGELRPDTASMVASEKTYTWQDERWVVERRKRDWLCEPVSIYEVHLGSWQRDAEGGFLNYTELARRLVPYVKEMGFTHVELMPITEHPFDASWGYQTTGYFAPTARHGTPDDFRFFVDYCHQQGIGVLLDWVPAHFPKDAHGLAWFDGTALYEHADPRRGEHRDWSTLIYNYGRNEVRNMLLASAVFWIEEFHVDGLRVDAVASILYLDYSRDDWLPNEFGGRENLQAIAFLKKLNEVVHDQAPGVLIMAEESTSWSKVTEMTSLGGLGFDLKWNMGWMNDTLRYMSHEPIHRSHHHENLTFSMLYAFSEKFLLPLSHDEVVHGKASLVNKMPGDEWQRFANLRALYTYQFTHPGKKLLFMGCEFAQGREWNSAETLDWYVRDYPNHSGVSRLVKDLNRLYGEYPALYDNEFDWRGFTWLDCNDAEHSILSYLRIADSGECLVVAINFTPVPRHGFRLGVPAAHSYREIFNSDAQIYAGCDVGNPGELVTQETPWMNQPCSVLLTLPPLAGVILAVNR